MNKKLFSIVLIALLSIAAMLTGAQEDNDAAFELAEQGVESNDEWEPVIQEFDGVEMVLVPAGSFMMGNSEEQFEAAIEQCLDAGTWPPDREGCLHIASYTQPVNEQQIDEPFWIGRFEVTNEQYGEAATGIGSFGDADQCANASSEADQPRNCVTWFDAKEHCESRGMRLPTEREWEYAARGPDALIYPWGNEFIGDNVVYFENSNNVAAEVGSRPEGASWVGAMDMSGNLHEWISTTLVITANREPGWDFGPVDEEFAYPYDAEDGREDLDRADTRPVLRGGGFFLGQPYFLRSSTRGANPGHIKGSIFGFRCARDYD